MHELGIALEIIKSVEAERLERDMKQISEIGVSVGALSSIDPESLRFCFDASKKDTALMDTQLEIEYVAVEGKCNSCARNFKVEDFIFICPSCGSTDIEVEKGEEMNINYIIGE